MERDAPMLCGLEKRIREALAPIGVEERSREPRGLVGVPDRARLAEVAGPKDVVVGRAGTIVGDDVARNHPQHCRVPVHPRREGDNLRRGYDRKVLRGSRHPIEERTPNGLGLLVEACRPFEIPT